MTVTRTHALGIDQTSIRQAIVLAGAAGGAAAQGHRISVRIAGQTEEVGPEVAEALSQMLTLLADGGVVIGPVEEDVTTGRAATMLGVSRTYVCRLVDEGRLPARYVGTHRRIKIVDIFAFNDERRAERKAALDELAQVSHDAGLYDDEV